MTANILAIGDIAGTVGLDMLCEKLHSIKRLYDISFTIANGENAASIGIKTEQAEAMLNAGVDVITLGNHTWGKNEIIPFLDDCAYILRPANFAPQVAGRGWAEYETAFGKVCVVNLIGHSGMNSEYSNPFFEIDQILKKTENSIIFVDFHAEMTSEKYAMAYYLDGRVTALWGTHTHVQTSDARVFAGGLGYITDLGMTGPIDSIIGMKPEQPISRFLGNPPGRFEEADGEAKIEGAIFEIDSESKKCLSVEPLRIF
ncbi:MAG: TIGR00282 family metallophosphoesterase [Oscillospiraceae bacterium]|nr:TIGR00282 family metallophosphoesterase [Oscillospiraceae bacterium]